MSTVEAGVASQTREPASVWVARARSFSLFDDVAHGFTGRPGGVCEGPHTSLNLAVRPPSTPEQISENWRRVAQALELELDASRVALMSQVHGPTVLQISQPSGPLATVGEADAMFTTEPGVVLAARTADCVPVLVAGDGVVGVAHAGWRGVVAGVVPALIDAIREATGTSADGMVAAIGPAISGHAYEVGPEIVQALLGAGLAEPQFRVHPERWPRPHVDLRRAVVSQLKSRGVRQIEVIDRCTAEDPRLFSHRADGPETGRQAGVIVRLPP